MNKDLFFFKKANLLFLLLMIVGWMEAQTHEFAPVGAEWYYDKHEMYSSGFIRMYADKDTIIDGISCIKLQKEKHWYNHKTNEFHSNILGSEFLSYENDSCLFFRNGRWHKLFDFSAEEGDTVIIQGLSDNICMTNTCKVYITGTGTELVNGVLLKYFEMKDAQDSDWGWSGTIVGSWQETPVVRVYERIGPMNRYFFPEQRCEFDYSEGGTLRCYEDSEIGCLNYTYPYTECDFIDDGTNLEEHQEEQITQVYPNPFDEMIFVDFVGAYDGGYKIEVFDLMGNLMLSSKSDKKHYEIATDRFSRGLYILKVITKQNTDFKTIIKR
jgi:hypothetical protein